MPRPRERAMQKMDRLVTGLETLVPFFDNEHAMKAFYKKITSYKRFKNYTDQFLLRPLPTEDADVLFGWPARCTYQVEHGFLECNHPLDMLHILAHYLQPEDSKWHGGEWGSIFLDLIERMSETKDGTRQSQRFQFLPWDTKRAAKDLMIENNIRTYVLGPETRERQSAAYKKRKVASVPDRALKLLSRRDVIE